MMIGPIAAALLEQVYDIVYRQATD